MLALSGQAPLHLVLEMGRLINKCLHGLFKRAVVLKQSETGFDQPLQALRDLAFAE